VYIPYLFSRQQVVSRDAVCQYKYSFVPNVNVAHAVEDPCNVDWYVDW
jgi:hypothetical protein